MAAIPFVGMSLAWAIVYFSTQGEPVTAPILTPLLQYGALGILTICSLAAAIVLWRRSEAALKREQDKVDRLEAELKATNQAIQDKFLLAISNANQAAAEAMALLKGINGR